MTIKDNFFSPKAPRRFFDKTLTENGVRPHFSFSFDKRYADDKNIVEPLNTCYVNKNDDLFCKLPSGKLYFERSLVCRLGQSLYGPHR